MSNSVNNEKGPSKACKDNTLHLKIVNVSAYFDSSIVIKSKQISSQSDQTEQGLNWNQQTLRNNDYPALGVLWLAGQQTNISQSSLAEGTPPHKQPNMSMHMHSINDHPDSHQNQTMLNGENNVTIDTIKSQNSKNCDHQDTDQDQESSTQIIHPNYRNLPSLEKKIETQMNVSLTSEKFVNHKSFQSIRQNQQNQNQIKAGIKEKQQGNRYYSCLTSAIDENEMLRERVRELEALLVAVSLREESAREGQMQAEND